ncbi:MAG: flippase-like domain-containing protein, partial [Muribaculaceae bacterium]|nr:flippase-like domain-containing protein [Muribaculaceae bacterium]
MQQTDTHKPTPIPHISIWKYTEKIFHYILPLAVSAGLIIWLFKKVDFKDMVEALRGGVNYWWLILMMVVLTLSRAIRGIRWGYQLRAAGIPDMPATAEVMSIFGAYALNLVFSWVGEAWSCLYVARRQHTSLSTVVGTDIGDRAS